MILLTLISLLPPFLLAFQLISLLCPCCTHMGTRLSLAIGLSIGISSVNLFIGLTLFGPVNNVILATETGIMLLLSAVLWLMRRKIGRTSHTPTISVSSAQSDIPKSLWRACLLVLVLASVVLIMLLLREPHGAWDGWAIWNMRARFLFLGGEHWTDAFSQHMAWSHPDYPLLLPAGIARVWYYLGTHSTFVPGLFALLFTFAIVALLAYGLAQLRCKSQACLGVLTLLGTDYYLRHGAYQYADTPLSFYILAATVLFCLHDLTEKKGSGLLFLAGLMAGFAAWTKNEGLLFILAIAIAHWVLHIRRKSWRRYVIETAFLSVGWLPIFGVVLFFKFHYAPDNDLTSSLSYTSVFIKLSDVNRYVLIAKFFGRQLISFGRGLFLVLLTYRAVMVKRRKPRHSASITLLMTVLLIMLCAYFLVYLLTPQDLQWHLNTSAKRLLLQLLPTAVFLFFMVVATPEEVRENEQNRAGNLVTGGA